jgi:hypothetical protein
MNHEERKSFKPKYPYKSILDASLDMLSEKYIEHLIDKREIYYDEYKETYFLCNESNDK